MMKLSSIEQYFPSPVWASTWTWPLHAGARQRQDLLVHAVLNGSARALHSYLDTPRLLQ